MAQTLSEKIRSLQLSAHEIQKNTGWASVMIEDYLNMIDSINTIVTDSDDKTDEIAAIELIVNQNVIRITNLEGDVAALEIEQESQNQLINLTQKINKNKATINKLENRINNLEQLIKG